MRALILALLSAPFWLALMLLSGAALLCAATYLRFGLPEMLFIGSVLCFAFAGIILRGMRRG